MSSEMAISRVGMSLISSKARRTQVVRATSPKVPIWGRPEGPYPVSNSTSFKRLAGGRPAFGAGDHLAGLLEGPGAGGQRQGAIGSGVGRKTLELLDLKRFERGRS